MVPRCGPSSAGEASEDDGWLLGHVTDENTLKSYVLVCPPTFFVLQPKIGRRARATEGKQAWNLESATFTRMAQQHHHKSLSQHRASAFAYCTYYLLVLATVSSWKSLTHVSGAGVPTTLPFHNLIMAHPKFQEGDVDTGFILKYGDDLTEPEEPKNTNPMGNIVAQAVKKKGKR